MNKSSNTAAVPSQRSPRNTFLLLFAAVIIAGVFVALPYLTCGPGLVKSVVLVDAEMRVEPPDVFALLLSGKPPKFPEPKKTIEHCIGTGFMVEGRLLTAAHVVVQDDAEVIRITATTNTGVTQDVKVLRVDKAVDLAELSPVGLPSLRLASAAPRVNDSLTEIGHPAGIRFVVSHGLLVGFDRQFKFNVAALDSYHGNSGGPVVNSSGRVVGLNHVFITGTRFTGIGTLQALRDFLYLDETR